MTTTTNRLLLLALTAFFCAQIPINAQSPASPPVKAETPKGPGENISWPQWAKDIRRFDVVMFGVFPFAWLIASTIVDLRRAADNGWDANYYPWPAQGPVPVAWEDKNYVDALLISAAIAVGIAVLDFAVIHIKRAVAARRERAYVPDAPEIRKTPINPGQPPPEQPLPEDPSAGDSSEEGSYEEGSFEDEYYEELLPEEGFEEDPSEGLSAEDMTVLPPLGVWT